MHKLSLKESMDGLEIAKTAKIGTEKQQKVCLLYQF